MRKLIALHFLCLLVFVAHAFASRSPALASGWKTYTNARFGYSISYPADVLMPQGESDNGDGQKFLSRDGRTQVLVYGSNALSRTLRDAYNDALDTSTDSPSVRKIVTYKLFKQDWFVVSGHQGDRIFYQKTFLRGGVFKTFSIEYDESQKTVFDAIAAKMARSFAG